MASVELLAQVLGRQQLHLHGTMPCRLSPVVAHGFDTVALEPQRCLCAPYEPPDGSLHTDLHSISSGTRHHTLPSQAGYASSSKNHLK